MKLKDLLRLLSSEANLQILSLLSTKAMNPRELARLLNRDESDVSRRLKVLEKAGLVEGKWTRVDGKNVRVYSLKVEELKIRFNPGEIRLEGRVEEYSIPVGFEDQRPGVSVFVGREKEIEELRRRKEPVLVVYGIAGIGKTALVAKAFPRALWYHVSGEEEVEYFFWRAGMLLQSIGYGELLEYLRSGGREEKTLLDLLKKGIEKTGPTIVIDDLHRCNDENLFRVLRLLGRELKRGRIVITSRVKPPVGVEGVFYLKLSGLRPEEAYNLALLKRGSISPEEFAELYRITRGHPLALNLIFESAPRGKSWSRENFFEFLFEEVYSSLTESEKTLLGIMALFSKPLEYEALKWMYPNKGLFPALHSLLTRGLIERIGDGYTVHEIIRSFVREVSNVSPEEYYHSYADYLLEKDSPEAFLKAFKYTIKAGDQTRLRELTELRLRKFREVVVEFPKTYMKILQEAGDNPYIEAEKAEIEFQRGFFEKAEEIWIRVMDRIEGIQRANVLTFLVDLYLEKEEIEKAEKYLKESRELAKELDNPLVWLWYQIEETKYLYYSGRVEEALESAFKELEFARRAKANPDTEALVFLHIGDILLTLNKPEEALEYYTKAKEVSEAYGISFRANIAYFEMAKAYYRLKRFREASEFARKAVNYFIRIRNYRRAVDSMAYLAVSLIGLGALEEAEEISQEMVKIGQATGYPLSWAGYIFLGALKNLKGEDGRGYFRLGREHLREKPWLYEAILNSLGRVLDIEQFQETFKPENQDE
ncbi:AAA family ATPase [Thermococcus stetteri]|uniref:AAA family ATPase n=1 Tax=Thermococcus stetteri TaxID=49900 RepID=UPI001AEB0347|nr:helix-turn-helix domain-containing protein [Thermococcus stetteri]MBP1910974.1 tetratricopeptide (TPR) repeat protein/DNA-binding transcriptional ArsR family regulator [Thermococcus stetteri]